MEKIIEVIDLKIGDMFLHLVEDMVNIPVVVKYDNELLNTSIKFNEHLSNYQLSFREIINEDIMNNEQEIIAAIKESVTFKTYMHVIKNFIEERKRPFKLPTIEIVSCKKIVDHTTIAFKVGESYGALYVFSEYNDLILNPIESKHFGFGKKIIEDVMEEAKLFLLFHQE